MRNTPSNLPRSYMILPTSSHDRPATDHPYHSHSSSAYGPTDSVDTSIDSDLPTSTYRLLPLPRIPAFDDQVHSRSSDISNNRVLPPFGTSTSVPPGFGTGAAEGLDHGNYSAHWTFDLDLWHRLIVSSSPLGHSPFQLLFLPSQPPPPLPVFCYSVFCLGKVTANIQGGRMEVRSWGGGMCFLKGPSESCGLLVCYVLESESPSHCFDFCLIVLLFEKQKTLYTRRTCVPLQMQWRPTCT